MFQRCRPLVTSQVSEAASSSLKEVRSEAEDWELISLEKLLLYLCANAEQFRVLLIRIISQRRLSLILYCDGITPGSALTADNKRKSVVWYASFLEFGSMLCHEELWMTMASARTNFVKKFPANLSGLTRKLLRDLFFAQDISVKGVRIEGEVVHVYFHALFGG